MDSRADAASFFISARVLRSFGLQNGQREMRKRRKPRYMETLFAGTSMAIRGSMLSNQTASQTTSLLGMAISKWEAPSFARYAPCGFVQAYSETHPEPLTVVLRSLKSNAPHYTPAKGWRNFEDGSLYLL
jgi:hypothetical protein